MSREIGMKLVRKREAGSGEPGKREQEVGNKDCCKKSQNKKIPPKISKIIFFL